MTTLFVSDIHLGGEHPEISERFVDFLQRQRSGIDALYILGDLFEVWIGDDAVAAEHEAAIAALREQSDTGLPIYVMHGNRDFLLGEQFEQMSGCKLIHEPLIIDLYGRPTLLMHGDTLCTDDTEYQEFRSTVRSDKWRTDFLAESAADRAEFARKARAKSQKRGREKAMAIMDVNQAAVEAVMREHGVQQLIHGHTHLPAVHDFELDGRPAQRVVLGDWYEQNSILKCSGSGCWLLSP